MATDGGNRLIGADPSGSLHRLCRPLESFRFDATMKENQEITAPPEGSPFPRHWNMVLNRARCPYRVGLFVPGYTLHVHRTSYKRR